MAQHRTVGDVMTRQVVTLFEEDNLARLSSELGRFHFRHLPVVDEGILVGILSQRDLLSAAMTGADQSPMTRAREARFLEQTFVRDVMRTDVPTARADETLRTAAKRMLDTRSGALPVVAERGRLIGIVSESDVIRCALEVL